MKNDIKWTKKTRDKFIEDAMLTEEEIYILDSRIKGLTVTEMSMSIHRSTATIHRLIKKIGEKYDEVQKHEPDFYPVRFRSKEEIYMDTH